MTKRNATNEEHDGELSVLLVVTVIIGMLLMASLLLCYICVFRQLCCEGMEENKKRRRRADRESLPLADITHVSSQPTETDRI